MTRDVEEELAVPRQRSTLARLRRDRVSSVALAAVVLVVVLSFAGGSAVGALVGHNGTDPFPYAANGDNRPVGPWTRIPSTHYAQTDDYGDITPPPRGGKTTLMVLGADGPLGRDELIRLLDGGRASLEIAVGAVLVALLIGVPLGMAGGYFGGLPDMIVSRVTETVMAFPLMLFLVFASVHLNRLLSPIAYGSLLPSGVVAEALLIGLFTSYYPARLVRAQLLPLRNIEYVEAAQMVGASSMRILRRHLLPHLLPTLMVWGAIAAATNILLEVGLSFIGAGVQPSTPTWGSLLSTTWGTIFAPHPYNGVQYTPWQTILPTAAILITVVSLNQVSEGFRRALDPREAR